MLLNPEAAPLAEREFGHKGLNSNRGIAECNEIFNQLITYEVVEVRSPATERISTATIGPSFGRYSVRTPVGGQIYLSFQTNAEIEP